jgi:hypothetical protein
LRRKPVAFYSRYKEALLGLFFLIFFTLVIIFSFNIKILVVTNVDARFWPRVVGVLGCLASLVHLGLGIHSGLTGRRLAANDVKELATVTSPEAKKTMGLIFVLILGIPVIGFLPMTIIYLFLQLTILRPKKERNYLKIAAIAVVFSTAVWVVFRFAFDMLLPAGIFWRLF